MKKLFLCLIIPLILFSCDFIYLENPFVAGQVLLGNDGKPEVPEITALIQADQTLSVSWKESAMAEKYNVYMSSSDSFADARLIASQKGKTSLEITTWKENPLTNDTAYYLWVTAENINGETLPGEALPAVPGIYGPSSVTVIPHESNQGELVVSWSAVDNAADYSVYCVEAPGTNPADDATPLTGIITRSCSLTGLNDYTTYHVWVTATVRGLESHYSALVSRQVPDRQAPSLSGITFYPDPDGGGEINGTVTISGTASDNVAVQSVEVAMDFDPSSSYYVAGVTKSAYSPATGSSSWTIDFNTYDVFAPYNTQPIDVFVRVTDSFGNQYEQKIDKSLNQFEDLPALVITTSSPVTNSSFSFAGTVSDDDHTDLTTIIVQVKKGGSSNVWDGSDGAIVYTVSPTGPGIWSRSMSSPSVGQTITYYVRATDKHGKSRQSSKSIQRL